LYPKLGYPTIGFSCVVVPKTVYTAAYGRMLSRLVKARKSAGLNQAELAGRLGRPQSFMSKVENGERRIDVVELIAICNAIGVDPGDVMANVYDGHVSSKI
jgi:transcriptional regulator with XRE-family HTH domain